MILARRLAILLTLTAVGVLAHPTTTRTQEAQPHVVRFSPEGAVKQVRQVVVRFSHAMVPLGDPRVGADAFEIACSEPGTARWIDSREWAYDFTRDLPAGVRCTFRLRAGVLALDGRAITGRRDFAFSTGGPAIKASVPRGGGEGIDETQAFLLLLDAEPTEATVRQHVWFEVQGIAERIQAQIIGGADRDAILAARGRWLSPGPRLIVQAQRPFPQGAVVTLVWGSGVAAASGVATTEPHRLQFRVRPAFSVDFSCEREQRNAPCLPVTPMRVNFSAAVTWDRAKDVVLIGPGGRRWKAETRDENAAQHFGVSFRPPFPESAEFTVELPRDLRDDANRTPINTARFPLGVKTGAFPPLAKFPSRFGVIERADPMLPVSLRRLEPEVRTTMMAVERAQPAGFFERLGASVLRIPPSATPEILPALRRVAAAKRDRSMLGAEKSRAATRTLALPKPGGADAFEVVGIPLERPGLYLVELESPRLGASLLGKPATMYVPTAALVTNLAVHFKWGAENALAWITTLDRARPVSGARVIVQDCGGATLWTGRTDGDGLARIPALPAVETVRQCPAQDFGDDQQQSRALTQLSGGLLVVAQTADDMTFVHSSWQEGIEPWRFGVRSWEGADPVRAHTVLDRALFRAGDTVHMKHLVRRKVLAGLVALAAGDRPTRIEVRHVGSEEKYEVPLGWSGAAADSRWAIPRAAKLGTWEVVLIGGARANHYATEAAQRVTATFRVEEFRVPLMRATLRPPPGPQISVTEVPIDVAVAYLSGGGAKQLPVTVRAQVQSRARPAFDEFDGFTFANGAVREGRARNEVSDEDDEEGDEGGAPGARQRPVVHQRDQLVLDTAGTGRVTIAKLPPAPVVQDLLTEIEWRDPSGETQTAATRIPLWPAARLVGMRTDAVDFARETLSAHVAVVDLAGRAVSGAAVRVDVFERKLFSIRKRLVGGFYAYDHVRETKRVGELCRGVTGNNGQFVCEGPAPVKGHLVLQSVTTDDAGRSTTAHRDVWVVGDEEAWWFDVRDSDRMDVLPDRRRYEPGDRARLQVRMPFSEATALVTTEREGVLNAFVTSLRGREPVVELPVLGQHAPNVFVTVLALRGRVGDVKPTALVDLGRPAFKLGMTEIRVGWSAHELRVVVEPEKATYRVRDRARVRVTARTPGGAPPPPGTEIALAAVDEGLLDLAPNRSWDALEAMMRPRGQSTSTSTMQMQIVGKRHFGKKALPQGGAGGRQLTRELFDTLLTWQGRIVLNERGEAVVDIPLNDSLTAFRIVAVATGGLDRFGTGAATIRTTQDLMVLPGIPPVVRGGDRFDAEVTLRNASARPMDLTATAAADGVAPLASQTLRLEPGQSRVVTWPVTAPIARERLEWQIDAREASGAVDQVRVAQRVAPPLPVRTQQATLVQAAPGAAIRQPVERPGDAVAGLGGVHVTLAPTLLRAAAPLRDFMRAYPYRCLEQDVSRAVALRDPAMWREIVERLPAHEDADGLLKFFPRMTHGNAELTSYVLAISHEAGYAIPDQLRGRIQGGLRKFVEGRLSRPAPLPSADLTLRKLAALEALSRYGAANAVLVGTIVVEPDLWRTSGVLDWWNVVRRVPGVPARDARARDAEAILRARLSTSGTTLTFSTEASDRLWWLMVSGDVNAVRTILTLLEAQVWRGEVPRLMRGALSRQKSGAWDLTLANAWGVLALEKFARVYESEPVTGVSTLALGSASEQVEWAAKPAGGGAVLAWPARRDDVRVDHAGGGRPWVTIETRAAVPLTAPLAAGYRVTRTLTPVERQKPDHWSRGDIVRIRLEIDAQSDMTWVVVNDPLPGGASHVGRGLRTEAPIALTGQTATGRAWPSFEERAFDSFRAYYHWVPKGRFTVEYTIRLEHAGRFGLPPTRVEALYAPEIFGELPNDALEIAP